MLMTYIRIFFSVTVWGRSRGWERMGWAKRNNRNKLFGVEIGLESNTANLRLLAIFFSTAHIRMICIPSLPYLPVDHTLSGATVRETVEIISPYYIGKEQVTKTNIIIHQIFSLAHDWLSASRDQINRQKRKAQSFQHCAKKF